MAEPADPHVPVVGFINIDKPSGLTSFDVVRHLRRAARTKRVGHTGTLDPAATGVLPVAIGAATKLVDELVGSRKRYIGTITLGVVTDTYDADGKVVAESDASGVSKDQIEYALDQFRGDLMQTPPAYSAVKRDGVPAYKAARAGKPHALDPRPVVVHSLELRAIEGPVLTVEVECGKGFYMRALAHDLGEVLGVGGHLNALRRTAVGRFVEADATPLDEAVERLERGDVEILVHSLDAVIDHWPALILARDSVATVRNGHDVQPSLVNLRRASDAGERARGYGPDGRLVALLEASAIPGVWHPYRVFAAVPAASSSETESQLMV
jgi:tRNA pseudouridine55 synthase